MARYRAPVIVALMLSLAVPGAATATTRKFRTPSGNIGCLYSSTGGPGPYIRCDVLSEGDDGGFFLKRRGKARRRHITDTVYDRHARILHYGQSRSFGRYTCRSRRTGLTCKNRRNGHGFKLSRERQRLF